MVEPNDIRYEEAITLVKSALTKVERARFLVNERRELVEAKILILDLREDLRKAEEVVLEIGDVEAAMRTGQAIALINERMNDIDEVIEADGE